MCLLPVRHDGTVEWKIWALSTWVESLSAHPEDERLLRCPGRDLDGLEHIETDVFIIGGGNSWVPGSLFWDQKTADERW